MKTSPMLAGLIESNPPRTEDKIQSQLIPPAIRQTGVRHDWYFTFGEYHAFPEGWHVVIFGTYHEARVEMFRRFEDAWLAQHHTASSACVEPWSLTEVGYYVAQHIGED
jgi:hypothetical protein